MMPHGLETDHRRVLERWAMQHFKNEVWETVLFHDPGTLPESTIQAVENRVLADAKKLISRLDEDCLRKPDYMNFHIEDAIDQTKALLRKKVAEHVRREQWKGRGRRHGEVQ